MFISNVDFTFDQAPTPEEAKAVIEAVTPRLGQVDGLRTTYFKAGPDGAGGSVMIWDSKEAAEAYFTDEWRTWLSETAGARNPEVSIAACAAVLDNTTGELCVGGDAT